MVKMLLGLWKIARDNLLVTVVEFGGGAAIVYGIDVQIGRGAAWIAAGVMGVLKAFELDLERPGSGPTGDR